jgi:hypothetical protein
VVSPSSVNGIQFFRFYKLSPLFKLSNGGRIDFLSDELYTASTQLLSQLSIRAPNNHRAGFATSFIKSTLAENDAFTQSTRNLTRLGILMCMQGKKICIVILFLFLFFLN